MNTSPKTALLLIDIQQSFIHEPYWNEADLPEFLRHSNQLIAGAQAIGLPIVRILHTDADENFLLESGHVRPLDGLIKFEPAIEIFKARHSALVGTGLGAWLKKNDIQRLIISGIRSEQCCETTTRHASDEGWQVDYVSDATLTFEMRHASGVKLSAAELKLRTETVLQDRFAEICSVEQALLRAREALNG